MDHALMIGIAIALAIIAVPVVIMTRIGWDWLASKQYEMSHLKLLQRAMVFQQQQMTNEAHMSMAKSKARSENDLRRIELERAALERQADEVQGDASKAFGAVVRDRDGLRARVEELEQENRRLDERARMAEDAMHESRLALDQTREECHQLDKMIAELRGESVITRSRG